MAAPNFFLLMLLPTILTFIVTCGVWIGVFFIAGFDQGSTTNYYCDTASSTPAPQSQTCPLSGDHSACTADCEFVICETLMDDLYNGQDYGTTSTVDCWMRLIESAQYEIVIGSYYWSLLMEETADCTNDLGFSANGKKIFDGLKAAVARGVYVRIAMNMPSGEYTFAEPYAIRDVNPEIVEVRGLNFSKWYSDYGMLHTKSWAVDGSHSYVGSANFDWRSLAQVKEIGMATFNCPCIAEDVKRMIDVYWYMGAEDAVIPPQWPPEYATNANHDAPYVVPRDNSGPATSVHFSSSPKEFNACGRDNDIDNMIKLIDEADEFVYLSVMDYAPATTYAIPHQYYTRLQDALVRAAMERYVEVRFMMSKWDHTIPKCYPYLHALDAFNSGLPCSNRACDGKIGKIDVRIFEIPTAGFESIPYSRVQHNKYFVTDKAAYIGTSNWLADYWLTMAGIGMTVRSADAGAEEPLVKQIKDLYLRDWDSKYTSPIADFDMLGKRK